MIGGTTVQCTFHAEETKVFISCFGALYLMYIGVENSRGEQRVQRVQCTNWLCKKASEIPCVITAK